MYLRSFLAIVSGMWSVFMVGVANAGCNNIAQLIYEPTEGNLKIYVSDPTGGVISNFVVKSSVDLFHNVDSDPLGAGLLRTWERDEISATSFQSERGGTIDLGHAIDLSRLPPLAGNDRYSQLQSILSGQYVAQLGSGIRDLEVSPLLGLTGDFNENNDLDIDDINLLTSMSARAAANEVVDLVFDLNDDQMVNGIDVAIWANLKNTWLGDADLDCQFATKDLVAVSQTGKYGQDVNASWSDGDWTGDGRFSSSDFVTAFIDGGYEAGPRPSADSVPVPEPLTSVLSWLGALAVITMRNRHRLIANT